MTVPPTARNAKRELKKTGHLLDPVRRGRRDAAAVSATAAGHAQGLRSHARRCLGLSSAATTALSFRRTALTRRAAIPTAPSPEPLGGLCTRRRSQAGRGATAGYVCAPTPTAARAPSAGTPAGCACPALPMPRSVLGASTHRRLPPAMVERTSRDPPPLVATLACSSSVAARPSPWHSSPSSSREQPCRRLAGRQSVHLSVSHGPARVVALFERQFKTCLCHHCTNNMPPTHWLRGRMDPSHTCGVTLALFEEVADFFSLQLHLSQTLSV